MLASLKTGGTRSKADHLAFETILATLLPDNAKDDGLMRTLQAMLGVDWDPLHRAELVNDTANLDELGSFSAAVAEACARERRRDFRGEGRRICMECAASNSNLHLPHYLCTFHLNLSTPDFLSTTCKVLA